MKNVIVLAALSLALSLTGCAVTNGAAKVESADVSFIQKGKTTKAEMIERLGPPTETKVSSGGKETLVWEYYKSTSDAKTFIPFAGLLVGSTTMETTTITASMDSRGRVADYSRSTGRTESRAGLNN